MPYREPGFWEAVIKTISVWWSTYAYAPFVAFLVAAVRGAIAGHPRVKTYLEGTLFALLTMSLRPLLAHFGLHEDLALFLGAFLAFLGADWIRRHIDEFARRWLGGDKK